MRRADEPLTLAVGRTTPQKEGNMFSIFYDNGHRGIEIHQTGQRWFLETEFEIRAFVDWLNAHAAQPSEQRTATPVRAKVTCSNGHIRVVKGRNWSKTCPECGVQTYKYDSRFGGL